MNIIETTEAAMATPRRPLVNPLNVDGLFLSMRAVSSLRLNASFDGHVFQTLPIIILSSQSLDV